LLVPIVLSFPACTTSFEQIKPAFNNSIYFPARQNGKWGFIDSDQQIKINFEYDSVDTFRGSIALAGKAGKYGYIDTTGRVVIPLIYDFVTPYFDDKEDTLVWVTKAGKAGFINIKTGKSITPLQYEKVEIPYNTGNDFAIVQLGNNKIFIDRQGKEGLRLDTQKVQWIGHGYFAIQEAGGWRITNGKEGAGSGTAFYDDVSAFNNENGLMAVSKNGLYGLIDTQEKVVVPFIYTWCSTPREGLCRAKKDGKEGFINTNNQVVIPFMYDEVDEFKSGYALVKKDRIYGLIDSLNHPVLPAALHPISIQYSHSSQRYTANYLSEKGSDSATHVIYHKGQKEAEFTGDLFEFEDSKGRLYYIVKKGQLYGIADSTGNLVVPVSWYNIHKRLGFNVYYGRNPSEGDYICVRDQQGEGVINFTTGKIVIDPAPRNLEASGKTGVYISTNGNGYELVKVNDL
jgi:hypothetical protein